MKSEHRHELAQNDLSKVIARWSERFDQHANTILSVAVVLALLAAGVIYWTRTSQFQRSNGWTQLTACQTPEDFANVADSFAGTEIADWARLRAADGYLREGIRLSVSDRPASEERLEQARTAYETLTQPGKAPEIREQALNGLAVTLETGCDGDPQPAVSAYERLIQEFPESRFKLWASDRIDALKTGRTQEFYAWFHAQNPKPADMPLPKDGAPAAGSSTDALPDLGNLKLGGEGAKVGDLPLFGPGPGSPLALPPLTTPSDSTAGEAPASPGTGAEARPETGAGQPSQEPGRPASEAPPQEQETPAASAPGTEPSPDPAPAPQQPPAESSEGSPPEAQSPQGDGNG
jgi:hypothetical protein